MSNTTRMAEHSASLYGRARGSGRILSFWRVTFDRVRGLIPACLGARLPALAQLDALRTAPITGVHLWFDKPFCPFDHVVTPGRLIQWVFNHTAIQGRTAAGPAGRSSTEAESDIDAEAGQYLQIVISASYDLLTLDKGSIRDAVLHELAEIWPAARSARLVRWWVVTEHGATFAVRPGVELHRPPQRTPIDGLFLAGDWTDTGWPATMEGAVRSGYLAAEGILADLDRPTRLIRPGLKSGWLALAIAGDRSPGRPPNCLVATGSRVYSTNMTVSAGWVLRPCRSRTILDLPVRFLTFGSTRQ